MHVPSDSLYKTGRSSVWRFKEGPTPALTCKLPEDALSASDCRFSFEKAVFSLLMGFRATDLDMAPRMESR